MYLIYDNPILLTWANARAALSDQLESLKNALAIGSVLGRIVILPEFHCVDESQNTFYDCPLNSLIAIAKFDTEFGSVYRESSFLSNPKVPDEVRSNVTSRLSVTYAGANATKSPLPTTVTATELQRLFIEVESRILSLDILSNVRVRLDTEKNRNSFDRATKRAFKRSDYRQTNMLRS
jgi:hypothetical protein